CICRVATSSSRRRRRCSRRWPVSCSVGRSSACARSRSSRARGTVVVGSLVARGLGATRRVQTLAAVMIGFSPGMLATNLLFQPVALDQLTTMVVLWLALRLALGRGSWPLLAVAAGIGLETKYTTAVVLILLIATFLVWRRDVLFSRSLPLAVAIAALLLVPNLVWEAGHGWTSVHWFLNPPPSG